MVQRKTRQHKREPKRNDAKGNDVNAKSTANIRFTMYRQFVTIPHLSERVKDQDVSIRLCKKRVEKNPIKTSGKPRHAHVPNPEIQSSALGIGTQESQRPLRAAQTFERKLNCTSSNRTIANETAGTAPRGLR
jgi:hypothetical protein